MSYKNSLKQIFLPILFAVILVLGIYIGKLSSVVEDKPESHGAMPQNFGTFSKLDEVLNTLSIMYVDTINKDKIVEKTIPEILKQLDPHTVYIPKSELEDVNSELSGKFSGIGVQFNIQSDTVVVIAVISNGPSQKVGILPGDRIIKVNDSLFVGKKITNNVVLDNLRGTKGTKVKLAIQRRDVNDLLSFDIIRDDIPVNTVDIAYMIEPTIGYIRVDRFGQKTYDEFMVGLAKLKNAGMEKLIIDLRGNSGGYLDVAINMCNEFLPKNSLIVYTKGRTLERQNVFADGSGSMQGIKVVALIDEFSASASEIVSGALQDNDRGTIVGQRSFGKGLVQQQVPLADGSALRVTIARYYTPSGRCIQKTYEDGVEAYYKDINNRYKHGEFFSKDSTHYKDTVQYKTVKGRTVYGGGGIMPDVFIPTDTTQLTETYYELWNHGNLYKFTFNLVDANREKFKSFKTADELVEHLKSTNLFEKYIVQAEKSGAKINKQELAISKSKIELELYAMVCRNIFNEYGYFPLLNKNDEAIKQSIEALNK